MPDSAASFFLKAIPCRLPKLLSWPLPFSKECGSGRRCRLWAERDAMFFRDDVNFPDGRRQVSGVGTTAAPCRPLKAAAHASSGTACRAYSLCQTDRSRGSRSGKARQENGFFHEFFMYCLNFQKRMGREKTPPAPDFI